MGEDSTNMPTQTPTALTEWTAWLRPDGRKGIRNLVLVIYTVECARFVAHEIARNEQDTQVIGFSGCYDNAYAIRLMLALARHPNVGAVLSVGLGCEYTQPGKIAEVVRDSGRPAEHFFIQDLGGTRKSIQQGKELVAKLRDDIRLRFRRVSMTPGDLVVGCECGGSDGTSGLAGNPVVGAFFDKLVDAGGTAIFEEIVEMIGLKQVMHDRAASPEAAAALDAAYEKALSYCQSVRQYSTSPGNFAGGLTTIEEKSMGAFAKSGHRPIQGVIKVAEQPPEPGLWLLDSVPDPHFMQFGYTNPNDTEGLMDLIAAGSHVILFVTGRGSVIGSPVAPLIKITGNAQTYQRMIEDMDFDASPVLHGEATIEQRADALMQEIVSVASGMASKPEKLGHREYFIMYKHQDTPGLKEGCRA